MPVPLGFWRGVEIMFNNFAVECFIDELALQAGRDPLEFRLAHLGEAVRSLGSRHKYFHLDRLRCALELAAARGHWGTPLAAGRGRGIAGLVFDGRTAAATVAKTSNVVVAAAASVPRLHVSVPGGPSTHASVFET